MLAAGASLHVCMTPHGPDTATFEAAIAKDSSRPEHLPADALAFMFEVQIALLSSSPHKAPNSQHEGLTMPWHSALRLT